MVNTINVNQLCALCSDTQLCLTLCGPMDCGPPGFFAYQISQARILEKVKVAQSCVTLCNPRDYTVHGIFQARKLEWKAIIFFRVPPNPGIKPRSPALQADSLAAEPPGKPKKYWCGEPIPFPVDLPYPGIKPESPALQAAELPAQLLVPGKNTGVGCHFLFQEIF